MECESEPDSTTLNSLLPDEILIAIFDHLRDRKDVFSVAATASRFRSIISSHEQYYFLCGFAADLYKGEHIDSVANAFAVNVAGFIRTGRPMYIFFKAQQPAGKPARSKDPGILLAIEYLKYALLAGKVIALTLDVAATDCPWPALEQALRHPAPSLRLLIILYEPGTQSIPVLHPSFLGGAGGAPRLRQLHLFNVLLPGREKSSGGGPIPALASVQNLVLMSMDVSCLAHVAFNFPQLRVLDLHVTQATVPLNILENLQYIKLPTSLRILGVSRDPRCRWQSNLDFPAFLDAITPATAEITFETAVEFANGYPTDFSHEFGHALITQRHPNAEIHASFDWNGSEIRSSLCAVVDNKLSRALNLRFRGCTIPQVPNVDVLANFSTALTLSCAGLGRKITTVTIPYVLLEPLACFLMEARTVSPQVIRVDVAPSPFEPSPLLSQYGTSQQASPMQTEYEWKEDPVSLSFQTIEQEADELMANALSLDVDFTSNDLREGEVVLPPRCEKQSPRRIVLMASGPEPRTLPKHYVAYVAVRLKLTDEAPRVKFALENVVLL
jgi:hypothetical protein